MKRIVSGLLAAFAAMSIGVTAFAATTIRNPDPDGQNKKFWCWAAAAKMVAEHNGGVNTAIDRNPQILTDTNTTDLRGSYYGIVTTGSSQQYTADGVQYAIVNHVFGDDGNHKGNDTNRNKALQFASARNMDVGAKGDHGSKLSSDLISEINSDLLNGKYVLGNMATTQDGTYHSVVIKSYNPTQNSYVVFDPWDKTNINYKASTIFSDFTFQFTTDKNGNMIYGQVRWFNYCR